LDLSAMVRSYRGSGSASYHPALLSGLLVYGYATGVYSSRKLERVTYDSVAFRFIAANEHPDHDTIATFRRRFLKDIEALFVRVLEPSYTGGHTLLRTRPSSAVLRRRRVRCESFGEKPLQLKRGSAVSKRRLRDRARKEVLRDIKKVTIDRAGACNLAPRILTFHPAPYLAHGPI
jgi:hypothetical protein